MTTAEIFADYLSLTPEGAPWAFDTACPKCLDTDYDEEPKRVGFGSERECCSCRFKYTTLDCAFTLTATSPLTEKPTPGWLEVLVLFHSFLSLGYYGGDYTAFVLDSVGRHINGTPEAHPTRAVAIALIAADPDLRARCEAASDWEVVK